MNAEKEFLRHVGSRIIKKAVLHTVYGSDEMLRDDAMYILKKGYTKKELKDFLCSLCFEYDNHYGCHILRGVVWFVDGSWSIRYFQKGSEYWLNHTKPKYKLMVKSIKETLENE